jgi:hypothetical protein
MSDASRSNRFKTRANLYVLIGIIAMVVGSVFTQRNLDLLWVGAAISIGGWAFFVWGSVNYVRWKGRSGWLGLLGYLFLPGLLALVCLQNRRRLLQQHESERHAEKEALAKEDGKPGYRYLLTLVPLAALLVGVGGLHFATSRSIDPGQWKSVAAAGLGFQALMPGIAEVEQKTEETPAGKVVLHKFLVRPQDRQELFMIVSLQFPAEIAKRLGGTSKLLEIGRQDLLRASQGQPQNEKPIDLNGCRGLELEAVPPKGAIIAARIYATENQIFQLSVHVPRVRLKSEDVQKFFESFHLSAEPAAAVESGHM